MAELAVKYKSQFDEDAQLVKGDCLDTCLAMIASYRFNSSVKTDAVSRLRSELVRRFTHKIWLSVRGDRCTIDEIKRAGKRIGIELEYKRLNGHVGDSERLIKRGIPHIAIVDYSKAEWREDTNYNGPHAVLVIGADSAGGLDGGDKYYIINDPDHIISQNKGKQIIPSYIFEKAWGANNYATLIPK